MPALRDALAAVAADGDQPPAVCARLHFALAQSAVAAHQPNLLRESLRLARLHGQVGGWVGLLGPLLGPLLGKGLWSSFPTISHSVTRDVLVGLGHSTSPCLVLGLS